MSPLCPLAAVQSRLQSPHKKPIFINTNYAQTLYKHSLFKPHAFLGDRPHTTPNKTDHRTDPRPAPPPKERTPTTSSGCSAQSMPTYTHEADARAISAFLSCLESTLAAPSPPPASPHCALFPNSMSSPCSRPLPPTPTPSLRRSRSLSSSPSPSCSSPAAPRPRAKASIPLLPPPPAAMPSATDPTSRAASRAGRLPEGERLASTLAWACLIAQEENPRLEAFYSAPLAHQTHKRSRTEATDVTMQKLRKGSVPVIKIQRKTSIGSLRSVFSVVSEEESVRASGEDGQSGDDFRSIWSDDSDC